MMIYSLRDGLSCCRVDEHMVFLDLGDDRYFRLSHSLETLFLRYVDGLKLTQAELVALIRQDILPPDCAHHLPTPSVFALPMRSALERMPCAAALKPLAFLHLLAIVWVTKWQLKKHPLKNIVARLMRLRQRASLDTFGKPIAPSEQALMDASATFSQARRYVPVDTSCLLDALCLLRFLAHRGLSAQLVFGVTDRPFSAHCWVQTNDLVLNDTVGYVSAFTPIRVL